MRVLFSFLLSGVLLCVTFSSVSEAQRSEPRRERPRLKLIGGLIDLATEPDLHMSSRNLRTLARSVLGNFGAQIQRNPRDVGPLWFERVDQGNQVAWDDPYATASIPGDSDSDGYPSATADPTLAVNSFHAFASVGSTSGEVGGVAAAYHSLNLAPDNSPIASCYAGNSYSHTVLGNNPPDYEATAYSYDIIQTASRIRVGGTPGPGGDGTVTGGFELLYEGDNEEILEGTIQVQFMDSNLTASWNSGENRWDITGTIVRTSASNPDAPAISIDDFTDGPYMEYRQFFSQRVPVEAINADVDWAMNASSEVECFTESDTSADGAHVVYGAFINDVVLEDQ